MNHVSGESIIRVIDVLLASKIGKELHDCLYSISVSCTCGSLLHIETALHIFPCRNTANLNAVHNAAFLMLYFHGFKTHASTNVLLTKISLEDVQGCPGPFPR